MNLRKDSLEEVPPFTLVPCDKNLFSILDTNGNAFMWVSGEAEAALTVRLLNLAYEYDKWPDPLPPK